MQLIDINHYYRTELVLTKPEIEILKNSRDNSNLVTRYFGHLTPEIDEREKMKILMILSCILKKKDLAGGNYLITKSNDLNHPLEMKLCKSTKSIVISFNVISFDHALSLENYRTLLEMTCL